MASQDGDYGYYDEDLPAPPRFLLVLVVGLFLLGIIGSAAGVLIYANALQQGQRERVKRYLPFMEVFDPRLPTPEGGIVPTAAPVDDKADPMDLLSGTLDFSTPESSATMETSAEPTEAAMLATATLEATPLSTHTPTPTSTTISPTLPPQPDSAQPVSETTINRDPSARLFGFRHNQQTWNNCGPANITMALSYYGWVEDQAYAASFLKPNREDKNVNPWEMVEFVNQRSGVLALTRMGGDLELIKTFIANGFPIIIESGLMPEGYDWLGHYRTLVGYDDAFQVFYLFDSFLGAGEDGQGLPVSQAEVDNQWMHFNRTFIVVFQQEEQEQVNRLLGEHLDEQRAAEIAFATAQDEARDNPNNAFAWFNMGTALAALGDYERAAVAFDKSRQVGLPFRMLWYQFGPFETYFNVKRYDDVLSLAQVNLTNGAETVEETHYWRGRVLAERGQTLEAANAFRTALSHNTNYEAAQIALNTVS